MYVLDGRSSAYDWVENGRVSVPLAELSRGLNPEKGYTVSANGKYTSDNCKFDYGGWGAGTAREIRISEMI